MFSRTYELAFLKFEFIIQELAGIICDFITKKREEEIFPLPPFLPFRPGSAVLNQLLLKQSVGIKR